ncbi:MAG: rRNA methyltransferase [Candidatus Doudnabacteria bacterium]|nr:rRNA methyltransferase [Candidatus Doudnabacteria bacterium]
MSRKYSLPTQLLLRSIGLIKGDNILIVGLSEKEALNEITDLLKTVPTVFNFDYYAFKKLGEQEPKNLFGAWYQPKKLHDTAIIYLPKSEALIEMLFSIINGALIPKGKVYVVGQNKAGIKSQTETIEKYIGPIEYKDAARHSVIYQSSLTQAVLPNNSLENWVQKFMLEISDVSLEVVSLPGVFSHGRLDDGTKMLLETLPRFENEKILDWGSGAGVIGAFIKKTSPNIEIDMVDSNALAVEASRLTMEENGFETERVWTSDIFSDVKDKYDYILSNPPFHKGIETNYDVSAKFIAEAKNHLRPGGKIRIVANTFLGYRPLLKKAFGNLTVINENNSYRVYESRLDKV